MAPAPPATVPAKTANTRLPLDPNPLPLAYLDAGSGSLVLQFIVAAFASVWVAIKVTGLRVTSLLFFWRRPASAEKPAGADEPADGAPTG